MKFNEGIKSQGLNGLIGGGLWDRIAKRTLKNSLFKIFRVIQQK